MIDLKDLKSLVKVMVDNNLTEIELQDAKGERVSLKRPAPPGSFPGTPGTPGSSHGISALKPAPSGPDGISPATAVSTASPGNSDNSVDANLKPIPSPMVGTFYAAPSPDAKPFVKVGDKVSPDTVVCIIEAMKVFNEIKAETVGTVARVMVEPGKAVEFGQPLFLLNPA